eukprot:CAMPEP_0168393272 /NCGR_PEP_ID=MMETSP0228-20121227/18933_1 /TAXON_ID=133427 /ORGANISM="Protoceratium reticulatum, Strain CCCM 535 (=CCMP 1889)" /LENGTH=57 /DNA_ID=CAMNT_0008406649 /DNA_START=325 /DNA_END=495 /DNA_ORIENTATION=+
MPVWDSRQALQAHALLKYPVRPAPGCNCGARGQGSPLVRRLLCCAGAPLARAGDAAT